jgi:hypothetical protein
MPRTSESLGAGREQPPAVQRKTRGKKAGRPKKNPATGVPEVVENMRTGADTEIAELKGDLHAHIF